MRILITGVAGFIGSNLAASMIRAGIEVLGIDNFDFFYERSVKENNLAPLRSSIFFSFMEGDVRDASFLNNINGKVDLVIHLAAKAGIQPSLQMPKEYLDVNINGTLNVLEWMKNNQVSKLVFASSSSVYGSNNRIPFSEEDTNIFPVSPYAMSKRSCELLNHTYHHLYNLDIINLRLFTVYGPAQRPDLAIHKFIRTITENKPVTLYGKGDTSRDYTYIDDVVKGIMAACEYLINRTGVFETINLGNNKPVSLSELVTCIERITGNPAKKIYAPEQPGDMRMTCASIDKAIKLLNYNPQTSLEDGLYRFYEWYKHKSEAKASLR